MSDPLVERLRSSAEAFRKYPVFTADGDPVLLTVQADELEEDARAALLSLQAGWRPEVRAFADLMEAKLRENDWKGGWKGDTDLDLFERLGEESAELLAALHRHAKRLMWGDSWVMEDTVPRVGRETADVANFAMMIADVCGALPSPPLALPSVEKAP
jgi:NTP pyrophosphatase (non-canonical NTP hydrolase)